MKKPDDARLIISPSEFRRDQKATKGEEQRVSELLLQVENIKDEFRWIELWAEDQTVDESEQNRRGQVLKRLKKQFKLLSDAVDQVNNGVISLSALEGNKKFQSAYDTFFIELQKQGLEDFLEQKRSEFEGEREQREFLESTEILPAEHFDPSWYEPEQVMTATNLVMMDIETEVGPDVRHRETVEKLSAFLSDRQTLEQALRGIEAGQLEQMGFQFDMNWMKNAMGRIETQEGKSNLWDDFCALVHDNKNVLYTILGRPETQEARILDSEERQLRGEEMYERLPNLLHVALYNSVVNMFEGEESVARQEQKKVLQEFYGGLPEELEYEAEATTLAIERKEMLDAVNGVELQRDLDPGLEILQKRFNVKRMIENAETMQVFVDALVQAVGEEKIEEEMAKKYVIILVNNLSKLEAESNSLWKNARISKSERIDERQIDVHKLMYFFLNGLHTMIGRGEDRDWARPDDNIVTKALADRACQQRTGTLRGLWRKARKKSLPVSTEDVDKAYQELYDHTQTYINIVRNSLQERGKTRRLYDKDDESENVRHIRDFSGWFLKGIKFRQVNFGCRLDLRGADCEGASFWPQNLEKAELEGTNLEGAIFEKTVIARECRRYLPVHICLGVEEGRYSAKTFERRLRNQEINRNANLAEVDMAGLDFSDTELEYSMRDAVLDGCNLEGAGLSHANIEGASFVNVRGLPEWISHALDDEGRFRRKLLERAVKGREVKNLARANLSDLNLDRTDFHGRDVSWTNFEGTSLKETQGLPEWVEAGIDEDGVYRQEVLQRKMLRKQVHNLTNASLRDADFDIETRLDELSQEAREREGKYVSYAGVLLTGEDINLAGVDMRRANMIGRYSEGIILHDVDCRGANFEGAKVTRRWSFFRCQLDGASMKGAEEIDAWIKNGLDENGIFSQERVVRVTRELAKKDELKPGALGGAYLPGINMEALDIPYRTSLSYSTFKGGNFKGVKLGTDSAEGADFSECQFDQDTQFAGARLKRAVFDGADLGGMSFTAYDKEKQKFGRWNRSMGAYLEGASFKETRNIPPWIEVGLDENGAFRINNLAEAIREGRITDLKGACIYGSPEDYEKLDLSGVDFSGFQLEGALFGDRDINLARANFSGQDFSKIYISNYLTYGLQGAIFRDAINLPDRIEGGLYKGVREEWHEEGIDEEGVFALSRYETWSRENRR